MRKFIVVLFLISKPVLSKNAIQSFSDQAWLEIAPIYQAIREHPFNQELEKGTLNQKQFLYYSAQDSLYLTEFSKALGTLANKLDDSSDVRRILQSAIDCLFEETKPNVESKPRGLALALAPASFAYTNFLLVTAAYKSREELAAALLPCFWIYLRLAQEMQKQIQPANPYKSWVDTYTSKKYRETVEYMLGLTNELARNASKSQRTKMMQSFMMASRLEWYFWEGAYRMEAWKPQHTSGAPP